MEDNEYVFVYAGDHLGPNDLERAIRLSSESCLNMIKPSSERRSSMITTILVYRNLDECCSKHIKAYREHRDFGFMLRGGMYHRVATLETSTSIVVSNRADRDVARNLGTVAGTSNP